ncbi:hypothetical protein BS17DRAFT_247003 [Gyrodon lividus]|nr:hypothetical protein BS17DRAFT_247003 [Gyrodon lividus]
MGPKMGILGVTIMISECSTPRAAISLLGQSKVTQSLFDSLSGHSTKASSSPRSGILLFHSGTVGLENQLESHGRVTLRIYPLSLSPDGTKIAGTSTNEIVRFWDTDSGDPLGKPLQHEDGVWPIKISI